MIKIIYVKFNNSLPVGPDSFAYNYLTNGQAVSSYKLDVSLSPDLAFVVVRGQHIDKKDAKYCQLVPVSNCASFAVSEDPYAPKSPAQEVVINAKPATTPTKGK